MKALVLTQYKQFELQERPVPEVPHDHVLVRVRACGICGSDVHGLDGSTGRRIPPIIMGHEAAGEIVEVGSAVTAWQPGDRVTFDSTVYCGECSYCRRGQINLCSDRRVLGVSWIPGGGKSAGNELEQDSLDAFRIFSTFSVLIPPRRSTYGQTPLKERTKMSTETTSDRELMITRVIDAPPAKVYKAWTDPELLKQWFAPKPWTTPEARLDVRPGGSNCVVMRGPDGVEFPNPGVYLEVVENERLVITDAYTEAWVPSEKPFMTLILTFEDLGGKTRYTARVLHWTAADRETHEKMGFHTGWGQCTDQLTELVTKG